MTKRDLCYNGGWLNRYLNGWKTVSICLLEFASDSEFVAYDECLYKGAECLKLECLWDK